MKVLVIGGGGREHAICHKLSQSKRVDKLFCAPGNAGIAQLAECIDIKATDINGVLDFVKANNIELVFVAPDDPLAMGMVDELEKIGVRAFGPNKRAALIEASKAFSKDLMHKYNIPTAEYATFKDAQSAKRYVEEKGAPIVVKADGLALGKGVIIAQSNEEAYAAIDQMMLDKSFGSAGDTIVVEEFMTGPEVSVLCFTDGKTIKPMVSSQDHKRVFDQDKGPNTGGMGAFAPSPLMTKELTEEIMESILKPTINAMRSEDRTFKGVLYFGLMLTPKGVRVLEYNARFGDPETQVVLPLLKTDLMDIIDAIIDEHLDSIDIEWSDGAAAIVIAASGGYPGSYEKGKVIDGICCAGKQQDAYVYHAGTALKEGKYVTAGGRVLGVTAKSETLKGAIDKAYSAIECISFEGMHFRKDIGRK